MHSTLLDHPKIRKNGPICHQHPKLSTCSTRTIPPMCSFHWNYKSHLVKVDSKLMNYNLWTYSLRHLLIYKKIFNPILSMISFHKKGQNNLLNIYKNFHHQWFHIFHRLNIFHLRYNAVQLAEQIIWNFNL